MEHYLQQLDKINQYLDFTDVNAFPIWRFVGSHLGIVIGLMALATFGHIIAEEMGYRWLEILAGITGIVLVVGIFGALVELAAPPHDRAGVTKFIRTSNELRCGYAGRRVLTAICRH